MASAEADQTAKAQAAEDAQAAVIAAEEALATAQAEYDSLISGTALEKCEAECAAAEADLANAKTEAADAATALAESAQALANASQTAAEALAERNGNLTELTNAEQLLVDAETAEKAAVAALAPLEEQQAAYDLAVEAKQAADATLATAGQRVADATAVVADSVAARDEAQAVADASRERADVLAQVDLDDALANGLDADNEHYAAYGLPETFADVVDAVTSVKAAEADAAAKAEALAAAQAKLAAAREALETAQDTYAQAVVIYNELHPVEVAPDTVSNYQGTEIVFTASGFDAGERVNFTVHSTEQYAGQAVANEQGVAQIKWNIPATFALGTHTITATGVETGRVASNEFAVIARPVASGETPDDVSAVVDVTTTKPGGTSTDAANLDVLAKTGATGTAGLAVLATMSLVAGVGAVCTRRRGRHAM